MQKDKKIVPDVKAQALNSNSTNSITQNKPEINNFTLNDFKKSGINQNTIDKYIEHGYLAGEQGGWKLFYPELLANKRSDYYTSRSKNPTAKSKYIKPKGQPSRLFRPLDLSIETLLNSDDYIIITEGEKKAIKAVQEGFNCISLAGVWAWKQKPKDDKEEKEPSDIIADIQEANWKRKTIILCYDNDLWENSKVKHALYSLACYLLGEKKAIVKLVILPKGEDKGLDDFLISQGRDEFQTLLNEAETLTLKSLQKKLSDDSKKLLFPINVFNDGLKDLLIELHHRLDAPLEYIASSFLTGASILMSKNYSIEVNKHKNWIDYPILWTAIIGNPSQKKSPCYGIIKNILDDLEQTLEEDYEKQKECYEKAFINYEIDLKKYKKDREKGDTTVPPEKPKEPTREVITVQDTTKEALPSAILENNGRDIAIVTDELSSFFEGLNQYKGGKGNDESYFLQAWKRGKVTTNRKGAGKFSVFPAHNILGSIQPKKLNATLFSKGIESTNGMIERWLFVCSDYEETETEYITDKPYSVELIEVLYKKLFLSGIERRYKFSNEAQKVFNRFTKDVVKEKKQANISDLMANYIQKQTDYVERFALILHCINGGIDSLEISTESVLKALDLSKFFIDCFHRITYQLFDLNPLHSQTLEYLKNKNKKHISPTELHKNNKSKYRTKDDALFVLKKLARSGYGRIKKYGKGETFIFYS